MDKKPLILVVDDEPDLCDIMEYKFSTMGYEVLSAGCGEEALEVCKKREIDAIISDIRMDRGSGVELLRQVREMGGQQIVIFVTGYADISLQELFALGVEAIYSKPADIDSVGEGLKKALEFKCESQERFYQRYASTIEVDWNVEGNTPHFTCSIDNISQGGMFICLDKDFPEMNSIVEFSFPNSAGSLSTTKFKGICKWIRKGNTEKAPSGIGVQFLGEETGNDVEGLMQILNAVKTDSY